MADIRDDPVRDVNEWARNEVNAALAPYREQIASLRREIASLRRDLRDANKWRDKLADRLGETLEDLTAAKRQRNALREASLVVTTDAAQDRLEDPIGYSDRLPYVRVHRAALDVLNAALAAFPRQSVPDLSIEEIGASYIARLRRNGADARMIEAAERAVAEVKAAAESLEDR